MAELTFISAVAEMIKMQELCFIPIKKVVQVLVHLQALQEAVQDLDLQVVQGEEAQVQDHLEVSAAAVRGLALLGDLAVEALVLDLNQARL
ncbi:hypothetical protein ABBQ38_002493 [Trebouxia sp. C0009 RCD-2024]